MDKTAIKKYVAMYVYTGYVYYDTGNTGRLASKCQSLRTSKTQK